IREELEKLAKELEFKHGYVRVATPNLAKESLYYKTGHLPYYADDMYPSMEILEQVEGAEGEAATTTVKEAYRLRPMNCPHHHKIFASEPRSYRDLPLRLAEYGHVYRFEDSGGVSGLVRVRGMCMNDAHIYCTKEQIKQEFKAVMAMYDEAYATLGLTDYSIRLSRWDPEDPKGAEKYVDNPEAWAESEQMLAEVLEETGTDFIEGPGEAAFYGPKLDYQFRTVTGREESVSTVQLDFAVPPRMELSYVGSDGAEHVPYCIHRAPFSTHERFVAFLIEHFGGAFPTWLAPLQVQVLTVSEQFDDYANELVTRLRGHMVRAELARSNDTVPKKIREGTTRKIPNLLIVGERERDEGTVTLRRYGHREQHTLSVDAFESALLATIAQRALEFQLPE
ncbi:MAG: threonine--tRNA ligase, partial [Pseudomonadales bacterium]